MTDSPLKTRRAFCQDGTLFILAAGACTLDSSQLASAAPDQRSPKIRIGLITDLHYADKDPVGSRHYRETPAKLLEAVTKFQSEKIDFIVELGDFIDKAPKVDTELSYLSTINKVLNRITSEKHYVLGNHCVDTLTKHEFLLSVGQRQSYYSFEKAGWHFIILDACFNPDGTPYERGNSQWDNANVADEELEWLQNDLAKCDSPVVVFIHQRLDEAGQHTVKNAANVRSLLEQKDVIAVFQGHSHANDHSEINGIHYITLVAMVEGSGADRNGYAILDLMEDDSLRVVGFRRQQNRTFSRPMDPTP